MHGTNDDLVPQGTWVEIERIILKPEERAQGLPPDTAATPLLEWIDGFLLAPAKLGEEVKITTIIGREHSGTLSRVNPGYSHSFGDTVAEILTIGTEHES